MTILKPKIPGWVADTLKSMQKVKWVKCPACGGEWTMLHPCRYFWFDASGRHEDTTHLCVMCAETVRGLNFCIDKWPGVNQSCLEYYAEWPTDGRPNEYMVDSLTPLGAKTKVKVIEFERLLARVIWRAFPSDDAPSLNLRVWCNPGPTPIVVHYPKFDHPMRFETTVAAWFWMKHQMQHFTPEPKPQKRMTGI